MIEPFSIRSLPLVSGAFAASPLSGTARRVSSIRRALATGRRCGLLLLTVLFGLCAAGARAQTVSFSYAITALGGGFSYPDSVAVDASGNVYLADYGPNAVYEIPAGCASSSCVTRLGGGFLEPLGVAVDASGNVYVADSPNGAVDEMPAGCASSSCVTSLGGGSGSFSAPTDVAVDGSGNVYVTDYNLSNAIKEMPAGCASLSCVTLLGGGFLGPAGLAVDGSGNVYVADSENDAVKEMPAGCASSSCVTLLGGGFLYPTGVVVDLSGNVYVTDLSGINGALKEMPAGCASSSCVTTLDAFFSPQGVAVDGSGNVYVANTSNNAVDEIMTRGVNFFTVPVKTTSAALTLTFTFDSAGSLSSTTPYQVLTQGARNLDFNAAATQESNACNGTTAYAIGDTCTVDVTFTPTVSGLRRGAVVLFDGSNNQLAIGPLYGTGTGPQIAFGPPTGIAITATVNGKLLSSPENVALDGAGDLFVTDPHNNRVVEFPAGGGAAISIQPTVNSQPLNYPDGLAVGDAGNLLIADFEISRILRVTPSGVVTAIEPSVNGLALSEATGLAVDGADDLFIADVGNSRVVEVSSGGTVTAINPTVNGLPLSYPEGVAVDGAGNLYIADTNNNRVVKVTSLGTGTASAIDPTVSGLSLGDPAALAIDGAGNLFIADYDNQRVVEISATGNTAIDPTVNGGSLNGASDVAVDGAGDLFIPDYHNKRVVELQRPMAPSAAFATNTIDGFLDSTDGGQIVQVSNIGNLPLTLAGISYPADFFPPYDANACIASQVLTIDEECDMPVGFAPASPASGPLSETVTLTDNSLNVPGAQQSIGVTGTATLTVGTTLTLYGGTPQSTDVTDAFASPLGVTLTDTYGHAVAGQTITFTAPASGASAVLSTSVPTNQYGLTTVLASANHIAGSYNVTATFGSLTPVTFTLTNNPPPGYVVTTALDDAVGNPANCPAGNSPPSANCSLRDALAAAATNSVGAITFDSGTFNSSNTAAQNTIALGSAGTLNVPPNTTITGPTTGSGYSLANLVTVAGGGLSSDFPVFTVNNDLTDPAVIANLSITQGNSGSGGGIAVGYGSVLTVTGCTISGNTSTGGVAGIFNDYNSVLTVIGSTISGNTGDNYGGIVNEGGGTVTVTSSTISNNTGKGILNAGTLLTVNASTISGNVGSYGGGGIDNDSGVLVLANSIVAGNTEITGGDLSGSYTDSGGNVVGGVNGVTSTNVSLAPLANYGGPTQTQLLLPGSMAICAGTLANETAASIAADQRGMEFDPMCPSGSVDSGAFQANYSIAFTSSFLTSYPAGPPLSPTITVELTESGVESTVVTSPVSITDSDGQLTGTTSVGFSAGAANFTNLMIPEVESSDTLTATMSLNPALAPPLNLTTGPSPSFQVTTNAATLISPAGGSQLSPTSQTFTWTPGTGAKEYWFNLGYGSNGVEAKEVFNSGGIFTTSVTVSNLGAFGQTVYATLYSLINGIWVPEIYTFTESGSPVLAALTAPLPNGSTLAGTTTNFTWNTGSGVQAYWFYVGTGTTLATSRNLYDSGQTIATSANVTGIPAFGQPIYVTLFSQVNGAWQPNQYTFTESGTTSAAVLNSPQPGTQLSGSSVTFAWTSGAGPTEYWLNLGTSPTGANSKNLYSSGPTTATSVNVTGLPTNGETIFATLYSLTNGVWQSSSYIYTAF
jgi:CSLREA domain-containing protein